MSFAFEKPLRMEFIFVGTFQCLTSFAILINVMTSICSLRNLYLQYMYTMKRYMYGVVSLYLYHQMWRKDHDVFVKRRARICMILKYKFGCACMIISDSTWSLLTESGCGNVRQNPHYQDMQTVIFQLNARWPRFWRLNSQILSAFYLICSTYNLPESSGGYKYGPALCDSTVCYLSLTNRGQGKPADIFECIFLNVNHCVLIKFSLRLAPVSRLTDMSWISNNAHRFMWDVITPCPNFNGGSAIKVRPWMSNYTHRLTWV